MSAVGDARKRQAERRWVCTIVTCGQPQGTPHADGCPYAEAVVEETLTKPPQRPHHWMNADGTCHAGDMFEHGSPAMPLYTFEQMQAWIDAERTAIANAIDAYAASEVVRTNWNQQAGDLGNWIYGIREGAKVVRGERHA